MPSPLPPDPPIDHRARPGFFLEKIDRGQASEPIHTACRAGKAAAQTRLTKPCIGKSSIFGIINLIRLRWSHV